MALPTLHRLRIASVRAETSDSISVAFSVPAELREAFRFSAGQFLTLSASPGGETMRRSYSICSSVREYAEGKDLRVGIRRVAGGRFSNWANDALRRGVELDVMTPDGRFGVEFSQDGAHHYLGIAGGSGITPLLSLIKTALETEARSRFTLIYGNRAVSSIMFLEEVEGLKNRFLERLAIFHVLSEESTEIELLSGLLDETRIASIVRAATRTPRFTYAFVCGPAPMMDAAELALSGAGLPAERIRIERFASPDARRAAPAANTTAGPAAPAPAAAARVTLVVDGKARQLKVPYEGASILDTALAAGISLPFACKAGVCCTCRARVLEGEVRMDRHYTLEQHELDAGFVLTCQSHPVTSTVRVSYDER
jgi:ring-1,2-phenylacetyl-CoA epoxidase subunit PaaE